MFNPEVLFHMQEQFHGQERFHMQEELVHPTLLLLLSCHAHIHHYSFQPFQPCHYRFKNLHPAPLL